MLQPLIGRFTDMHVHTLHWDFNGLCLNSYPKQEDHGNDGAGGKQRTNDDHYDANSKMILGRPNTIYKTTENNQNTHTVA